MFVEICILVESFGFGFPAIAKPRNACLKSFHISAKLNMGTKITYKSLGHDPNEDYRWVAKSLKKEGKTATSEKELKKMEER